MVFQTARRMRLRGVSGLELTLRILSGPMRNQAPTHPFRASFRGQFAHFFSPLFWECPGCAKQNGFVWGTGENHPQQLGFVWEKWGPWLQLMGIGDWGLI
jgi:hypothetical protein